MRGEGVKGKGGRSKARVRYARALFLCLCLLPFTFHLSPVAHAAAWEKQKTGTFAWLHSVYFVDEKMAFLRDDPQMSDASVIARLQHIYITMNDAWNAGDLLPARRSWAHMPVAGAVRPFAPGDASTRIHWLSSARHGLLMVKDSERSVGQRLWVALDVSSPFHAGAGEESTVEYGVEAAAYVAELAFKAGLDVGLLVTGAGTLIAEPARGRDQREHLLDLLAMARDGMGPGFAATIAEQGTARPSDALVLLTPALPPDLLDLCARLRRLGCGVAAVLLDAGSFGGALVPPDEAWLETERIPIYTLRQGSL